MIVTARCYTGAFAAASRPSVRLSVSLYVGGLWSHRLEFVENNVTVKCSLSAVPNITDLLQRKHQKFWSEWVGYGKSGFRSEYKSSNISETRQDKTKVTIEDQ